MKKPRWQTVPRVRAVFDQVKTIMYDSHMVI